MAYTALPVKTMTVCILAAWACQWMNKPCFALQKEAAMYGAGEIVVTKYRHYWQNQGVS
jgi:hypothetical protein